MKFIASQDRRQDAVRGLPVYRAGAGFGRCVRRRLAGCPGVHRVRHDRVRSWLSASSHEAADAGRGAGEGRRHALLLIQVVVHANASAVDASVPALRVCERSQTRGLFCWSTPTPDPPPQLEAQAPMPPQSSNDYCLNPTVSLALN